jgi:hypothetical protein
MEQRPYVERLLDAVSADMSYGRESHEQRYEEILRVIDNLESPEKEDVLVRLLLEQGYELTPPPQLAA